MHTQLMLESTYRSFGLILLLLSCIAAAGDGPACVPSARQLAWSGQEFTVFVHFGMNTFSGLEWGSGREPARAFHPAALDAGQWVRAVQVAGSSGVVLVAKHHDGFCLWPSQFTEHSVRHAPWREGRGDLVREVAEACRAASVFTWCCRRNSEGDACICLTGDRPDCH